MVKKKVRHCSASDNDYVDHVHVHVCGGIESKHGKPTLATVTPGMHDLQKQWRVLVCAHAGDLERRV